MAECVECGSYTKYKGGLCPKCYAKSQEDDDEYEEEIGGLSDIEKIYTENMVKGRIAETLIQELFLKLNYRVFRYGMEHTVPGIVE